MDVAHIMLGRPWHFDRRVLHDGHANSYLFVFKDKHLTLLPMSPSEALSNELERTRLQELKPTKGKKALLLRPRAPLSSDSCHEIIAGSLGYFGATRSNDKGSSTIVVSSLALTVVATRGRVVPKRGRMMCPSSARISSKLA